MPRQANRDQRRQQHECRGNPQTRLQPVRLIHPARQQGAEQAAEAWRIPGYAAGGHVLVPVLFGPGNGFWSRKRPYDFEPVAWVLEAQDPQSLAAGGGPTDGRIKRITPLGPPSGPTPVPVPGTGG